MSPCTAEAPCTHPEQPCIHWEEIAPGERLVVMIYKGEPVKVSLRKDED